MKVIRLSSVQEIVSLWTFFCSCFEQASRRNGTQVEPERMFKVLSALVVQPNNAWVGICVDSFGNKLGVGVVRDSTPLFSPERESTIEFLHFDNSRRDVILALQRSFERWCNEQHIKSYHFPSQRFSGAAVECFERFKLRKSKVIYSKCL